jgi:hypothetical protein
MTACHFLSLNIDCFYIGTLQGHIYLRIQRPTRLEYRAAKLPAKKSTRQHIFISLSTNQNVRLMAAQRQRMQLGTAHDAGKPNALSLLRARQTTRAARPARAAVLKCRAVIASDRPEATSSVLEVSVCSQVSKLCAKSLKALGNHPFAFEPVKTSSVPVLPFCVLITITS